MEKLPLTLFDDATAKAKRDKLELEQSKLQKSVAFLSEALSLKFTTVQQLETLSPEWLEDEIKSSVDNVKMMFGSGVGFLPGKFLSDTLLPQYNTMRKECAEPLEVIRIGLEFCKKNNITIVFDNNGLPWYDGKDIDRVVNDAGTYTFSDDERDFYKIIASIFDKMDKLRDFEKEHNVTPCDLQGIINERMQVNLVEGKGYCMQPKDYFNLRRYGKVLSKKTEIKQEDA